MRCLIFFFLNAIEFRCFLFLRHERKEADLLQTLNDAEIDKEEETSTLFRAASLTTTLMDHYMKSVCTPFLAAAVSETIHKLMEAKQSCEVLFNQITFVSFLS